MTDGSTRSSWARLTVVTANGWTVISTSIVIRVPPLSATRIVNELVPAVVGVPRMWQSLVSASPDANPPLTSAQLYGGRPERGVQAALYARLTRAGAGVHLTTKGPRFTTSWSRCSAVRPNASRTRTVTGLTPVAVEIQ
jgi:hypothetical protein